MNIIITEILSHGQEVRDKVERRLRSARMQEEHIMKVMIADVARDERLGERAGKRLAWLEKNYRMVAEVMTVLDWEDSMEVDMLTRDVTKDVDGDTIMTDKSA